MLNVPGTMPFHHFYPKPQVVTLQKKDGSAEKPKSFQEILNEKMSQKR